MKESKIVLNDLLVNLFHDILEIEEKALRDHGSDLTITEIHTIDAIGDERPRTMSEVARDLNITMGTLTTAADKLIKKGYVLRKRTEEDKRVVLVELTPKGREAKIMHDAFHQDMIKSITDTLTEEEESVLIESLKKLMGFFGEKYALKKNQ
ncbi:MAG TPA: MarR family transcriptional regulator [Clostridiaceae bacterium]|nr:MarR family transcriptional regulator [Clostridiaceae bacterium]